MPMVGMSDVNEILGLLLLILGFSIFLLFF